MTDVTKIYNSRLWRDQVRPQKLGRDPVCQAIAEETGTEGWPVKRRCHLLADHVDHWQPLADGGKPWDHDNLVSLCVGHHSQKTIAQQHGKPVPFEVAPSKPYKPVMV